jgi:hypothetical protein
MRIYNDKEANTKKPNFSENFREIGPFHYFIKAPDCGILENTKNGISVILLKPPVSHP